MSLYFIDFENAEFKLSLHINPVRVRFEIKRRTASGCQVLYKQKRVACGIERIARPVVFTEGHAQIKLIPTKNETHTEFLHYCTH